MYPNIQNPIAHRQRLLKSARFFRIYVAIGALVAILTAGCEPQVQTGYGRATGIEHTSSVNGTVIFHKMLKSNDRKVHRYSQLSPRWEKYQTIYWMPNNFEPPEQNIVDRIDEWLTNDSYRTFIYVCRDYDASIQYWEALKNRETNPDKADELNRLYINAICEHIDHRNIFPSDNCDWFDTEVYPFTRATQFSGELTQSLDLADADIRYSRLAKPGDVTNTGQFGEYDASVLMSVDSHPFIYELTNSQFDESRIVVISNASFLLNLSLTNAKNRELASSLIEYVGNHEDPYDNVLFIESDQRLPISDRDSRDKYSQWSWITKKPMRYIVPNLLICFIMLCFVYYPIFGRPKKIRQSSTANFRDHIYALGQLIKKSKTRLIPNAWIEEYRRRVSGTRAPQVTEPKVENEKRKDESS